MNSLKYSLKVLEYEILIIVIALIFILFIAFTGESIEVLDKLKSRIP